MPVVKYRNGNNWVAVSTSGSIATSSTYGYLKVATDADVDAGTNDSAAITARQLKNYSDGHFVHKTGNETIDGIKTFTQNTFMQSGDDMSYCVKLVNADNTSSTQSVRTASAFRAVDDNYKIIGDVRIYRTPEGESWSSLVARSYVNTSEEEGINSVISCIVDNQGNISTQAPTPPAGDNSSQIATTQWCNLSGNNLVHKTGTETIGGTKTFSGDVTVNNKTLYLKNSESKNATLTNNSLEFMPLTTKTNGGFIDFHYAGSTADYTSRIIEDASGQLTYQGGERFTATNATNSGVIATKGWVNDDTAATNVVHRTGDETIAGNKTFENRDVYIKSSTLDVTDQSITGYEHLAFTDKNDKELGHVKLSVDNGKNMAALAVCPNGDVSDFKSISISVDNTTLETITSCPQPTHTTSTTSKEIATVGWVNTVGNNVVHRSGNETIGGTKTLSGVLYLKDNNSTIGTTTNAWQGNMIQFQDSAGTRVARLQPLYVDASTLQMGMYASNGTTTESGIYVRSDGVTYAPKPGASNSTSWNNIATVGWVNDASSSTNVVHRSGTETIGGQKTFTSNLLYDLSSSTTANSSSLTFHSKDNNLDLTTDPEYTKEYYVAARDKDNRYLGYTSYKYNTDGSSQATLYARTRDADNTANKNASISVKVGRDGTVTTYAPTPATSDSSTKIATTAYVNNKIKFVNSLPANPESGVLYLIPE